MYLFYLSDISVRVLKVKNLFMTNCKAATKHVAMILAYISSILNLPTNNVINVVLMTNPMAAMPVKDINR